MRYISIPDARAELLTDQEVAMLEARARASGRLRFQLTDFLTEQEWENVRHRRQQPDDSEIGS